jgi:hypothetical protein
MNSLNNNNNNLLGSIYGMIGGMWKFLFIGIQASFMIKLLEAAITAFVCGILGAIGKLVVDYITKRSLNKKTYGNP